MHVFAAASVMLASLLGLFTSDSEWIGKKAPELARGAWINSQPLTLAGLKGKVVLLEFWTFGCYNCRNTLPAVKSWHKKFPSDRLVIIGIHTPEFESEMDLRNVQRRVSELGIEYPIVTDNEYKTWEAYNQRYWPVIYLLDKKGVIRYMHIGEGAYDRTESEIERLISE